MPTENTNVRGNSRRRLPFDSTTTHMSSSSTAAVKRAVANTFRYPSTNHRTHEIFLDKSSSSSITADDDDDDGEVSTLDQSRLIQSDQRQNPSSLKSRHSTMNHSTSKREMSGTMIEELIQSNMDLKKEIRDIRRQIKHNHGVNKQRIDRAIPSNKSQNVNLEEDDDEECSFAPTNDHESSSATMSKLQHYKTEANTYKQQLETCQSTITQLRKTIHSMEKRIEQLKNNEHRQVHDNSSSNHTDHRFIHELFHLCIKYTPRSSKLKTHVPSHHDMKTFIRQTFTNLIQSPSPSSSKISAKKKNSEVGHFICKCSDRSHPEHRPTYQYSLSIIEQCQSLFDVSCFTQLPTALNELYYRYGELTNFKRSIASTLGVTALENSRSISCPKIIKTLQQTLDDARSNELITFKKMAKINDMNEAVSKIRSYDDFVPYYHQFIEQMANLLEVSKGDEIMPAIKTLKLLAHGSSSNPQSLHRTSSLNTQKTLPEKSKIIRMFPSKSNEKLSHNDPEQTPTGSDSGDF